MKPPKFLKRAHQGAVRVAKQEVRDEVRAVKNMRVELFLLQPTILLFRKGRGPLIPKNKLRERFAVFAEGHWKEESQSVKSHTVQQPTWGRTRTRLRGVGSPRQCDTRTNSAQVQPKTRQRTQCKRPTFSSTFFPTSEPLGTACETGRLVLRSVPTSS